MEHKDVNLCCLGVGETGKIIGLECDGELRRRLLDMGFTEGTPVKKIGDNPSRDPSAYLVRGAVIALRKRDSERIFVRSIIQKEAEKWD